MQSIALKEIMTTDLVMVTKEATVADVLHQLTDSGLSCLLLINNKQEPESVITEQSLLKAIAKADDYQQLLQSPCDQVGKTVVTARGHMTIEEAISLINNQKTKQLIVVNEDYQVSGLVTHTDLVNSYASTLVNSKTQMELKVQERTQELETANRKLASMSLIDPLTGLSNRRALQVDIMKTHAASIRHDHSYSIALVDVDYFKKYNDHYGHQMGDDALQDVAQLLRRSIRETDYLYRYGGEEFLILMPETNVAEARVPMERLIKSMAIAAITHERSPYGYLTVSVGVASSNPRLIGWREVIELADRRLYDAKDNGRNQVFMKDAPEGLQVLKSG